MNPWLNTPRRAVIKTASVPAPVGGLNARDSVAAMPPTDAIVLKNWFPFPYALTMRQGWKERVVGMTSGTNPTIAEFSPISGTPTVIAFTGGKVYVITSTGPAPTASITGMLSDYWQTTMFCNVGGNYLYCVNGVDSPRIYNGVAFTTVLEDLTPPPAGFDISGIDPKTFVDVAVHQRRLWFVQKNSTQAWFLPVDQLGGVAQPFEVGQLFKFGGYLMAIYTWAGDSGDGMNDKLVFISSSGEVAVYSGTDPEDAASWGLEGVIRLGAPVGRRCGVSYGGDLILLTANGAEPLSRAFQSTKVNTADNLTDKIQHTISSLISEHYDKVGWEMLLFPNENQIWIVVPIPADQGGVTVYAMNTITGAWCQFTNMDIQSSCLIGLSPYFITKDGRMCQAWTGYFDNVPWNETIGDRIELEVVTAYNYFQSMGITKRWTMVRPIFQAGAVPASAIKLEVDFEVVEPLAPSVIPQPSEDYIWDQAIWDAAKWDVRYGRYRRWQSVEGMGYAAAMHMVVAQDVETLWAATDFVYELGGTV